MYIAAWVVAVLKSKLKVELYKMQNGKIKYIQEDAGDAVYKFRSISNVWGWWRFEEDKGKNPAAELASAPASKPPPPPR